MISRSPNAFHIERFDDNEFGLIALILHFEL